MINENQLSPRLTIKIPTEKDEEDEIKIIVKTKLSPKQVIFTGLYISVFIYMIYIYFIKKFIYIKDY